MGGGGVSLVKCGPLRYSHAYSGTTPYHSHDARLYVSACMYLITQPAKQTFSVKWVEPTNPPAYGHDAKHADIPVCIDTLTTCFTATGNLATAEGAGYILLTVGTYVCIYVHVCMGFGISLYYMLDPTLL